MSQSPACATTEQLQELLDGNLPEEQQADLTAHLEQCETCQQSLESLVAGENSWQDLARNLGADQPPDEALEQQETLTVAGEHHEALPEEQVEMKVLDHYELIEQVGQGAFGTVYRAHDAKLQRVVAIKMLSPEVAASGTARQRFIREARAAAAVTHENVVAIHAIEEKHRPPYIVMQMIDGFSLQEKLNETGSLELREILRIGMQIASGLAAAHKQGLVHRDIKPSNVLLENGVERVKITDFGLARAVDDASISRSGEIAGTPMYMSPEQADGQAIDHRSDLFSLGSVLYVMCTGRPPFRATTTMGVLKRVCEDTPRPIREINPEIPTWLEDVVTKLHAKKRKERFQSADEVAELLGQYLATLQQPVDGSGPYRFGVPRETLVRGPAPQSAKSPGEESTDRHKRRYPNGVAMLFMLLLLGVVGIFAVPSLWRSGPQGTVVPNEGKVDGGIPKPPQQLPSAFILTSNEYEWTEPQNLGSEINSKGDDGSPWISTDGLTLLFASNRSDGQGASDIWQCTRAGVDADWSKPVNLGAPICSPAYQGEPVMSADFCTLVFVASDPIGSQGKLDLWMASRGSANAPWGKPVNLGATINSPEVETGPFLSEDGLQLVFNSNRGGSHRLYVATRLSANDRWSNPALSTHASNRGRKSQLLDSGKTLLHFQDDRNIYLCTWNEADRRWGNDVRLPAPINNNDQNTRAFFHQPTNTLYFMSDRPGGHGGRDLWMSRRVRKKKTDSPLISRKPFVILTRDKGDETQHATLADAVKTAQSGDTIEIRGNGPFLTPTIEIPDNTPLTIRAGRGYRPVLEIDPQGKKMVQGRFALIGTTSALVLEGLELRSLREASLPGRLLIHSSGGSFLASHCRFLISGAGYGAFDGSTVEMRDCEFIGAGLVYLAPLRGQIVLDNCIYIGGALMRLQPCPSWRGDQVVRDLTIQISRSTFIGGAPMYLLLDNLPKLDGDQHNTKPIQIKMNMSVVNNSNRVFGLGLSPDFVKKHEPLTVTEVDAVLRQLIDWHGRQNVYTTRPQYCYGYTDREGKKFIHFQKEEDWQKWPGTNDKEAIHGPIRYQGSNPPKMNLLKRLDVAPLTLAPADFRLASDSAGKGAGPNGKDLGADVDFVGPGEAYERWKKTPEYKAWRKKTDELMKARNP